MQQEELESCSPDGLLIGDILLHDGKKYMVLEALWNDGFRCIVGMQLGKYLDVYNLDDNIRQFFYFPDMTCLRVKVGEIYSDQW